MRARQIAVEHPVPFTSMANRSMAYSNPNGAWREMAKSAAEMGRCPFTHISQLIVSSA
jgi:hypothetical protein